MQYEEYKKNWKRLHREHTREYQRKWKAKNMKSVTKSKLKYKKTNLEKVKAWKILSNRLSRGNRIKRIIKTSFCEWCGKDSSVIHGHHPDYLYPLQVIWMCPLCHVQLHREGTP